MDLDNVVKLAKIEGNIDTLIALTKNDVIDNAVLVERLSNSVIELKEMYERGDIDNKYMYDLASDVSDKIESVDPGECFWTLNFEYKSGGKRFPLSMVIDDAKALKSVTAYNLSMKKDISPIEMIEVLDAKPSVHFTQCLQDIDKEQNIEYEKRFLDHISDISPDDMLVLSNSLHVCNKIGNLEYGTSKFNERVSFLHGESDLNPILISGQDYIEWYQNNKIKIIDIYRQEDECSITAEIETSKDQNLYVSFQEKLFEHYRCKNTLLDSLHDQGCEHRMQETSKQKKCNSLTP